MNTKPATPNLICPDPTTAEDMYFTDNQSQLNVTRHDKFLLVMDVPAILKPILLKENRACHGGNLERLKMSIWGFVIPEIKVDVMDKPYGGQHLKFSNLSRPAYPPINVNFTIDNRFDNYFILYKWIDIQNDDTVSRFDGKGMNPDSQAKLCEYASTFTIFALDEYDKPTAQWDYIGAFPTSIKAVESNYRENKELESSFTFEFSQLKMSLL
jgi:hypothetical protein